MQQPTFIDETGHMPSSGDFASALRAIDEALVQSLLKLPPSLAVELLNIRRCVEFGAALRPFIPKEKAPEEKS